MRIILIIYTIVVFTKACNGIYDKKTKGNNIFIAIAGTIYEAAHAINIAISDKSNIYTALGIAICIAIIVFLNYLDPIAKSIAEKKANKMQ